MQRFSMNQQLFFQNTHSEACEITYSLSLAAFMKIQELPTYSQHYSITRVLRRGLTAKGKLIFKLSSEAMVFSPSQRLTQSSFKECICLDPSTLDPITPLCSIHLTFPCSSVFGSSPCISLTSDQATNVNCLPLTSWSSQLIPQKYPLQYSMSKIFSCHLFFT